MSSALKSVLDMLVVVFIVGLRRHFTASHLGKACCKFQGEFDVELHGMDDDRDLMARYNARHEASGMVEFDRFGSRLRKVVHEAFVNRFHE